MLQLPNKMKTKPTSNVWHNKDAS